MPGRKLRVIRIVPTPAQIFAVARQFAQTPEGTITSFADGLIPGIRDVIPEFGVEVKPFGAVVKKLAHLCGTEPRAIAAGTYVHAAAARACLELAETSPFFGSRKYPGTHARIVEVLRELRAWNLDPAELAKKLTLPFLQQKLRSLAEVERSIDDRLSEIGLDRSGDHIAKCLESVPELDGDSTRYLVYIGDEFDPQRLRWLQWAASVGLEITVVLYRHAANVPLFQGAERAATFLGEEVEDIGDTGGLAKYLFQEGSEVSGEFCLRISSAPDALSECEWAIRSILSLESTTRTAIYVRNPETYGPLLVAAARRLGAKLSFSQRVELLSVPAAQATLQLLRALSGDDPRSLGFLADLSYCQADREKKEQLTSRLKKAYRTGAAAWSTLETDLTYDNGHWAWLLPILQWRSHSTSSVRSVEWHARFRELQVLLPWFDPLDLNDDKVMAKDRVANPVLLRSIAAFASVDQMEPTSRYDFASMVEMSEKLWQQAVVSIPRDQVGIRVCTTPDHLPDVDCVVILGMVEGTFPRRRSEHPVLDDFDRAQILEAEPAVPSLSTSRDVARAERDLFYRVCIAARSQLLVSYPRASSDSDCIPAYYLEVLSKLVPGTETKHYGRREWVPESPSLSADVEMAQALRDRQPAIATFRLETDQAKEALAKDTPNALEISEILNVNQCPFRYTFQDRLRIRPKRSGARWSKVLRLPMVAQLASQPSEAAARAALTGALEDVLDELFPDLEAYEMRILRIGAKRLIEPWIRREFASREVWDRRDTKSNVGFTRFNEREVRPSNLRLKGTVAGVAERGTDITVIDFESSVPESSDRILDRYRLKVGLIMLGFFETGRECVVELDGANGRRVRVDFGAPKQGKACDTSQDLYRLDLAGEFSVSDAKRALFTEVREFVEIAMERIRDQDISAVPGDYCQRCAVADLCRVSLNSPLDGEDS
jgi:hypothetical protein